MNFIRVPKAISIIFSECYTSRNTSSSTEVNWISNGAKQILFPEASNHVFFFVLYGLFGPLMYCFWLYLQLKFIRSIWNQMLRTAEGPCQCSILLQFYDPNV